MGQSVSELREREQRSACLAAAGCLAGGLLMLAGYGIYLACVRWPWLEGVMIAGGFVLSAAGSAKAALLLMRALRDGASGADEGQAEAVQPESPHA